MQLLCYGKATSTQLNITKKSSIRSLSKSSVVPRRIYVTVSVIATLQHSTNVLANHIWFQSLLLIIYWWQFNVWIQRNWKLSWRSWCYASRMGLSEKPYYAYWHSENLEDFLLENDVEIQNILALIQLMATISPSTAACESVFSAMNRGKTSFRISLKDYRCNNILWICINGELLEKFDSRRSFEMWLSVAKNATSEDTDRQGPEVLMKNLMLRMKMI